MINLKDGADPVMVTSNLALVDKQIGFMGATLKRRLRYYPITERGMKPLLGILQAPYNSPSNFFFCKNIIRSFCATIPITLVE